jgi:hypothetical protein
MSDLDDSQVHKFGNGHTASNWFGYLTSCRTYTYRNYTEPKVGSSFFCKFLYETFFTLIIIEVKVFVQRKKDEVA